MIKFLSACTFFFFLLLAFPSFSHALHGDEDKHNDMHEMHHEHKTVDLTTLDTRTEKPSQNGIFTVSLISKSQPVPLNKIHSWVIAVKKPDGTPVHNASIRINADMPEHGHNLPTVPVITEDSENGTYLLEGMKFQMPGWWTISLKITSGNETDDVIFNTIIE